MSSVPDKIQQLALRHQVIAGNIANAQTPNYKPKDVFAQEVSNATKGMELKRTNAGHLSLEKGGEGSLQVLERESPMQPNPDGSFVDIEVERANLMRNANHLQGLTRAATHYLRVQQLSVN